MVGTICYNQVAASDTYTLGRAECRTTERTISISRPTHTSERGTVFIIGADPSQAVTVIGEHDAAIVNGCNSFRLKG